MKRQFMLYGSVALLSFLTGTFLQAQDTIFKTLPAITITSTSKVVKEVSNSFRIAFPEAQNAAWYKLDKNYLVMFMTNDQSNRALFNKYGYLIYHIRYGNENNMPRDIRNLVKSRYSDYKITSVIFVNQDERNVWVINVENDKRVLVLRSEDGELDRIDLYKKI
ncbi:MAG TPA: hypothetical protein VMT76_02190 [Puia sp.]|nr:hypothetical protein [Puia sp.]